MKPRRSQLGLAFAALLVLVAFAGSGAPPLATLSAAPSESTVEGEMPATSAALVPFKSVPAQQRGSIPARWFEGPEQAGQAAHPGQGWPPVGAAVDHVGLGVGSLAAAIRFFEDTLGFRPGPDGAFPEGGMENCALVFGDRSYLELLAPVDSVKAAWLLDFIASGPGGLFVGLRVPSVAAVAARLRDRGIEATVPEVGTVEMPGDTVPEPRWWTVTPQFESVPEGVFFIQYDTAGRDPQKAAAEGWFDHPNTARRLRAVWYAVPRLEPAANEFQPLGFQAGPPALVPQVGGRARELSADSGSILLVEPSNPEGAAADLVGARGGGVLGVSIEVADLEQARRIVEIPSARLETYSGLFGRSFLIPASIGRGLWIEFVEAGGPSAAPSDDSQGSS